jgi:predicted site-specific integrase-resolvase
MLNTEVEKVMYTRKEFAEAHRISVATLQRLIHQGKGPKLIQLEGKMLISKEAAKEWVKQYEDIYGSNKLKD